MPLEILHPDRSQAPPVPEPAYFKGEVRMQPFFRQVGATTIEALAVHFSAGAHTRPHTHDTEQVIHFVEGDGFVQLAGEERQLVPQGSLVVVPIGVVHMHGATEDGPICHVALRASKGATNWQPPNVPEEWRDLVSEKP